MAPLSRIERAYRVRIKPKRYVPRLEHCDIVFGEPMTSCRVWRITEAAQLCSYGTQRLES